MKKVNELSVVGPFLGPGVPGEIRIFIALPYLKTVQKLTCQITQSNSVAKEETATVSDEHCRLFSFFFSGLDVSKTYGYRFLAGGEPLDLQGGLKEEDCHFRPCSTLDGNDSFILLSCHNPFGKKTGSTEHGWRMWERLCDQIASDSSIRLLLMAGDQVYNDEIEHEYMKKLKGNETNEKVLNELRSRFIRQYLRYWEDISYRKVLAQIPSLAIWDDHDITDGWGGRPESFENDNEFKSHWLKFYDIAAEVFAKYQTPRNSNAVPGVPGEVFTSFYDWGDTRFYLLDFRSEKNSRKNQLWENVHETAVFDSLRLLPDAIKRIFFVSPVVPLRTNFQGDSRLSEISKFFFKLRKFFNRQFFQKTWVKIFHWLLIPISLLFMDIFFIRISLLTGLLFVIGLLMLLFSIAYLIVLAASKIPEVPDLSDDLEDGLSANPNKKTLERILKELFRLVREKETRVVILSGDIHIGGVTEIVERITDKVCTIPQIVSSAISNKPMPKVVEGLTSTTSEMNLDSENELFARNIFYKSKRNFVQIFPKHILEKSDHAAVSFHFEDHRLPISFDPKYVDIL